MSNSSLINLTMISPNRNAPRNHEIDTLTIHMTEGQVTAKTLGEIFMKSSRQASCNYGIGCDANIVMCCPESDRSFCSGSRSNDNRAITIEVASDNFAPYAVTDVVYKKLIDLCVDIVRRNPGFKGSLRWRGDKNLIGQTNLQNMTVHKWFQNTNCPGDFLMNHMVQIAEEVNRRLSAPTTVDFVAGDIVYFKGGYDHSNSQDTTTGNKKIASLARVSKVAAGAKYPYHCRRINEKGAYISGGVYGWVCADSLTT